MAKCRLPFRYCDLWTLPSTITKLAFSANKIFLYSLCVHSMGTEVQNAIPTVLNATKIDVNLHD